MSLINITTESASVSWLNAALTFGAVILGGLLTYLTTNHFTRTEEKARLKGSINELLWKLVKITNDAIGLQRQLLSGIREAEKAGVGKPLWGQIPQLAALKNGVIEVTPSDLVPLTIKGEYELPTKIMELENGYKIIVAAIGEFYDKRDDLARALGSSMRGKIASFALTKEDAAKYGPELVNLETLAERILELSGELSSDASELLDDFRVRVMKLYNYKEFPNVVITVDETVKNGSNSTKKKDTLK